MIGPNSQPTAPVPKRWAMNSTTRMTNEIGTTRWLRPGAATFSPSIAERTEIAGVIMPSPKNKAAPKIPSMTNAVALATRLRCSSAARAMIPPSPRLWARMMNPAYLIDTTIVRAQKISETIP